MTRCHGHRRNWISFAGLVTEMKGHSVPMGTRLQINFSIREPLGRDCEDHSI